MKETLWIPDTCGCKIVYEWDADLPNDEITLSLKRIDAKCEKHAALLDGSTWTTVLGENVRKNEIIDIAGVAIIGDGYDPENLLQYVLGWRFEGTGADRVLYITVTGINSAKVTQLQGLADSRFGVGKVIIELV